MVVFVALPLIFVYFNEEKECEKIVQSLNALQY